MDQCTSCVGKSAGDFFGTPLCADHFRLEVINFLTDCRLYFGV